MRRFGGGRRVLLWAALFVLSSSALLAAGALFRGFGVLAVASGVLVALFLALSAFVARGRGRKRVYGRAGRDPLTGLPDRTAFLDHVSSALDRTADTPGSAAVLVVDLDDFEEINHALGHDAGDRVLEAAGERIRAGAERDGVVSRLCGDEFAVLLGDGTDGRLAVATAGRIVEMLKDPISLGGGEVMIGASVGVAVSGPGRRHGPQGLLRDADVAMHAAKRRGKGTVSALDPDAHTTTSGRLLTEAELRRALEEDEFLVYYQPIVEVQSHAVRGFEALVRWRHPVYGLVPPAEFVPVAERTGLIVPLGRRVLEEACRRVRQWQREQPCEPPLGVNVNVSAHQFRHPNLAGEIFRALEKSGMDPQRLKLEITESAMAQEASVVAVLRELEGSGIGLVMDDFGTGYSNLSYVKRLPVGGLKIDRTYVAGLGKDPVDTAIVRATIAFAGALGLETTAEGIESHEQLAFLEGLGCQLAQGYYFARPLPARDVPGFMAAYQAAADGRTSRPAGDTQRPS